jgi:hypothetical protein
MAQKLRLDLDIAGEQTNPGGTSGGIAPILERLQATYTFPEGTAAGEAAAMWADDRTVASGAVDALELDNLPAIGPVGAVAFTKIKGFAIFNTSASDYLTVGGGSGGRTAPHASAWSDTDAAVALSPFNADTDSFALAAGDYFVWTSKAGVGVSNGGGDILGIEGFTSTQAYKIILWGDV